MESNTNSILALIIALVAIIFGPVIQLFIARKQFSTQTSNLIRNDWVKELRILVADFVTGINHHINIGKLYRESSPDFVLREEVEIEKRNAIKLLNETNRLRFRVMAMLDQNDEIHCKLIDKMNELRDLLDKLHQERSNFQVTIMIADILQACNTVVNYTYDQMFKGK